jgi:hypothetical protein
MRRCGRCKSKKPVDDLPGAGKLVGSETTPAAPAAPSTSRSTTQRTNCGETDPIVLEFDHLRDKKFNIGKAWRGHEWQSVLDEIAKCEVVCANCHRRRTACRGGFIRAVVAQR